MLSTSPRPTGEEPPRTPDQIARDRAYEAWLAGDIRRRGVMARHAWNAAVAWAFAYKAEQEQP